jgi:glutathione S-transferase
MRRLTHLVFSPASRLARLLVGEKRLTCDYLPAEDASAHLPVFVDADETRCDGLWAIVNHLENNYEDHPLFPEDADDCREALRWLDYLMGVFPERVLKRIVYERANPRFTGAPSRSSPDMNVVRKGREELNRELVEFGRRIEPQGNLVGKHCSIADLALAADLSALDYFGEVKWDDFPPMHEWYMRIKSRPAFHNILSDSVPAQPPVSHYAELDF